jgi:hypothetical protein
MHSMEDLQKQIECGNRRQQLVTFPGHTTYGWLRKTHYTIYTKQKTDPYRPVFIE